MFILLLSAMAIPVIAEPLPGPIDLPSPPGQIAVPSKVDEPVFAGRPDSDAPMIAAISDLTRPGETLVITGSRLDHSALEVWVQGHRLRLPAIRRRDNRMFALLPERHADEPLPYATMLVWPVDETTGAAGTPIRVNGATAWWLWPRRCLQGHDPTVRLFGKSLALPNVKPAVVLESPEGQTYTLPIVERNPYHLAAALPDGLTPGRYRVWAHNGTGGRLGWAEPQEFDVVPPISIPDRVTHVDDFDPPRFHNEAQLDAAPAIQRAIDRCAEQGGGTVRFGPRGYALWQPLKLPNDVPIVLQGAGMGEWDFDRHEPRGRSTWLLVPARATLFQTDRLIEVPAAGSRIEDLTISVFGATLDPRAPGSPGVFRALNLSGQDQQLLRVRVFTLMPQQQGVWLCHQGTSNHRVVDCEFICGSRYGVHLLSGNDDARIASCRFWGFIRAGRGTDADAICAHGGNRLIVENCRFESVDRARGRILSRSVLLYNNGMHHSYLANNVSLDCGAHPSVPGISRNVSEHYLFHTGRRFGGVIDVVDASADTLRVNPDSLVESYLAPSGQVLPEGKQLDGQWVVAITRGRGVGQWRVIRQAEGTTWHLDRPWRVVPESGAKATVQPAFRQHIVYNNYIDTAASDPSLFAPNHKSTGIYLYHCCVDNVVAGNTLVNLGQGLAVAATFDSLAAWNLFRDNELRGIRGTSGGTSPWPTFYNEHMRTLPPSRGYPNVWFTFANICRGNRGENAAVIGHTGWLPFREDEKRYQAEADTGQLMSVIENNTFTGAKRGFILASPANWAMLRNNRFETLGDAPPVERFNATNLFEPVVEPCTNPTFRHSLTSD